MRRWNKKIWTTAVLLSALTGQVYAEEPAAATDDHTLGEQFEATVARAAAARDALSTKVPGLTAMLNETGAGNRIEMIRLMAAVGELIGEDGGVRGGAAPAEKSIYPNTDFSRY